MRRYVSVMVILLAACGPLAAQTAQPPGPGAPQPKLPGDRNDRRLLQRFVEDAAVSTGGWVEMQYRFDNLDSGTSHLIGPQVAFKIVKDVEAGVRFGFLDVRPDGGSAESGLSDVDLFAKYRFPGGRSRGAVGGLVKLPAADESKGLGTGEKDFEAFGAWRADLEAVSLAMNAGFRLNGDPNPPLPSSNNTVFAGGSILLPASPFLTFVIESTWESSRVDGGKDDARLTLGVQKQRRKGRGGLRGGIAVPLGDGAPDYQVIAGAFLVY